MTFITMREPCSSVETSGKNKIKRSECRYNGTDFIYISLPATVSRRRIKRLIKKSVHPLIDRRTATAVGAELPKNKDSALDDRLFRNTLTKILKSKKGIRVGIMGAVDKELLISVFTLCGEMRVLGADGAYAAESCSGAQGASAEDDLFDSLLYEYGHSPVSVGSAEGLLDCDLLIKGSGIGASAADIIGGGFRCIFPYRESVILSNGDDGGDGIESLVPYGISVYDFVSVLMLETNGRMPVRPYCGFVSDGVSLMPTDRIFGAAGHFDDPARYIITATEEGREQSVH